MKCRWTMKTLGDNVTKRAAEGGGIGLTIGTAIGDKATVVAPLMPSQVSFVVRVAGKVGGLASGAVGAIAGSVIGAGYGVIETVLIVKQTRGD